MAIVTASGTKLYIGAAVTDEQADTLAEFQAMTGWVEVTLIESIGPFGDSASDVTFAALGDSRVRHAKGARDGGSFEVVVAHKYDDAGQLAVEAAQATNDQYAFRITLPDATSPVTDTELFFRALVQGAPINIGSNDNVIRKTYRIGLQSEVFTQVPVSV